ncbi:hypothetical protein Pyn_35055 [Prunus yedoensis var. nudiflora]|uniref:Uncharacterized protein n=1 Tax=Prunus yedoensis var. nudiflora TaxID=2094558 RepID=A0A314ZCL1_PRUYE|nr:hypothetical protein Pyn_35055 [Prunus yedoensis var. nudiflora]
MEFSNLKLHHGLARVTIIVHTGYADQVVTADSFVAIRLSEHYKSSKQQLRVQLSAVAWKIWDLWSMGVISPCV